MKRIILGSLIIIGSFAAQAKKNCTEEPRSKWISEQDFKLAAEKNEPAVLVIGSNPYRRQVEEYLTETGLVTTDKKAELSDRERAFEILVQNGKSNLGWRIILAE